MGHVDVRINALAARRHGAITMAELRAAGVSRTAILRRVAEGTLVQRHPDVFVHGTHDANPSRMTEIASAVAACGPEAMASHETAVELLGIWKRPSGAIHVSSTRNCAPARSAGFQFHRRHAEFPPEAVCMVDGIPTLSPLFACAQLGVDHTEFQIVHMLHEGRFQGLLKPRQLSDLLDELGPVWGKGRVRRALELYELGSAGTRSASEDRLVGGLRACGVPEPLVNVRGATSLSGVELDFVWPELRVVVELDGPQHEFEPAANSDAEVDAALRDDEWHVLRIPSALVWQALPRVVEEIQQLLLTARIP